MKIDGPTIHVFLAEAIEGWPFKIENDSDYSFRFSQTVSIVCTPLTYHSPCYTGPESCQCRTERKTHPCILNHAEVQCRLRMGCASGKG